MSLITSRKEGV